MPAVKTKPPARRLRPLRVDPSRTSLLRRKFAAELQRRFSSLKADLVRLVQAEDCFGLGGGRTTVASLSRPPRPQRLILPPDVANAFCATGEGGGVDPTCSPPAESAGKVEHRDVGSHYGVHLRTEKELHVPGAGVFKVPGAVALAEASREKHQMTLVKVHADEELRGKGVPRRLLAEVSAAALRERLPLRTTGVFSEAGRRMMDKLVRDGYAERLPGGDYELRREKLVRDYGARPAANAFCPTGKEGGVDPTCSPGKQSLSAAPAARTAATAPPGKGGALLAALKGLGASAAHLEHTAKVYLADKVGAAVARLPGPAQTLVKGSFHLTRAGTAVAFATWTAGQALAEKVAKARGMTADEAKAFRGTLATLDVVAFKPIALGLGAAGVGHLAAGVLSLVPPATAGYLAYSAARYPLARARAALSAVRSALGPPAPRGHDRRRARPQLEVLNAFCPTGPGGGIDPTCPPKSRLVLPLSLKQREETQKVREARANTPIPSHVILPDVLYVAMPSHAADRAMAGGHSGETKGLLGHEYNRRDSVYLATDREVVRHYAGMYADSKTLAVDLHQLDRSRLYYDANEPPNLPDKKPFGLDNPGYVAYRGRIPASAFREMTHNAADAGEANALRVAAAYRRHDFDDWYAALFHAALDLTGDGRAALKAADAAYARQPKDASAPADNDPEAVFGKAFTANAFCPTGPGGGVDPTCSPEGRGEHAAGKSVHKSITVDPDVDPVVGEFVRETLAAEMVSLGERFPKLVKIFAGEPPLLRIVGKEHPLEDYTVGQYRWQTGEISVSPERGGDLEIPLRLGGGTFSVGGNSIYGSYRHELGHHVAFHMPEKDQFAWSGIYTPGRPEWKERLGAKVSEYAKTNTSELFAEAFEAYTHKDYRKGMLPRPVEKALEQIVGPLPKRPRLIANAGRWAFQGSAEQVAAFQGWLRAQVARRLTSPEDEALWREYAKAGYEKGAARAFDEVGMGRRGAAARVPAELRATFASGAKDQFLREVFSRPASADRVRLVAKAAFSDVQGVTGAMAVRMGRVVADGLLAGWTPHRMARELVQVADVTLKKAQSLARNEIVRAQAEGQLDGMERLGVSHVNAAVEWSTAADGRVCPRCAALEGVVLAVGEARGLVPLHPECRCSWLPAITAEAGQVRGAAAVRDALDEAEVDRSVGSRRPRPLANAFCPTGEGGGVDPTCGKGQGGPPAGAGPSYSGSLPPVLGRIAGHGLSVVPLGARAKAAVAKAHRQLTEVLAPGVAALLDKVEFAGIRVAAGAKVPADAAGIMLPGGPKGETAWVGISEKHLNANRGSRAFTDPSPEGKVRHEVGHAVEHLLPYETMAAVRKSLLVDGVKWNPSLYGEENSKEKFAEFFALVTKPGFKPSSLPKEVRPAARVLLGNVAEPAANVRSYFAVCPRDRAGHCAGGGGDGGTAAAPAAKAGKRVSPKALAEAQARARAKAAAAREPTPAEARRAGELMDALGADDYETNVRGNSKDRAASRARLLKEFGDGTTCPCIYCGLKLDDTSVTRDKIYTARQGGRYRHDNLVPACLACNKSRGDTPWESIDWGGGKVRNEWRPFAASLNGSYFEVCPRDPGGHCLPSGAAGEVGSTVPPPPEPKTVTDVARSYVEDADRVARSESTQLYVDVYQRKMAEQDARLERVRAAVAKLGDRKERAEAKYRKAVKELDALLDRQQEAAAKGEPIPSVIPAAEKTDLALAALGKARDGEVDAAWRLLKKSAAKVGGVDPTGWDKPAEKLRLLPAAGLPEHQSNALREVGKRLSGFVSEVFSHRLEQTPVRPKNPDDNSAGGRSFYRGARHGSGDVYGVVHLTPGADAGTVAHELGHSLESAGPVHNRARGFLYSRVGTEPAKPMGEGYKEWEVGRDDDFAKAFSSSEARYVGKHYKSFDTEVVSMGLEKLYRDPVGFARKDPEYFKFTYGLLTGGLL